MIFTYYALSGKLIYNARQCCVFLRDVIDIDLLWAVQELDIICASVLYISTWCHWCCSTVSSRGTWDFMCVSVICQRHDLITHSGCREKNRWYIDAVYIYIYQYFVQHRCALLCWVTVHIFIVDFHTEYVYFDEHGAEFIWWPPGVRRLYLNVDVSKHQWKLDEKVLGLLERNLRGKYASAIRAANKVVNKFIPLLKSDNLDLGPVKEYSVELHQYIALIVDTHEEFDSTFAGHLEILASFGEWLQPQFDVSKSVLEYSTAWIESTTNMFEVPSGAGILPIDNGIELDDSIS